MRWSVKQSAKKKDTEKKRVINPDRLRQLLKLLLLGSGLIGMLALLFFAMFRIFERITYDSISDLNREFAGQIDSLTDTINASIVNYGMQLFYSDAGKTLMGPDKFTNTERVYLIRDLNTSLSSTDFAESVILCNGYTGQVYSTDPSFPEQPVGVYRQSQIRELLMNRTNENRFKPIFCQDSSPEQKQYYAFMFYELYPDGSPKPSTLIITVKSDWYKKYLLASNPASDLIVINKHGDVLVTANDTLPGQAKAYYPQITKEKSSGYFINHTKKEICMYYESPVTGLTYMKISPLAKTLPRLLYFKQIVVWFMLILSGLFGAVLLVLLIFALLPMLKMKAALKTVSALLEGDPAESGKAQIRTVVTKSKRANLEKLLSDMLSGTCPLSASQLFEDEHGFFGLMLLKSGHRKDIYPLAEKYCPSLIAAKASHCCACLGMFSSEESFCSLALLLSEALLCRVFVSPLFADFNALPVHYVNLDELRKLELTLPSATLLVREEVLLSKAPGNTITTRDFTDLIVRLKSGSLELSRAKWQEMFSTIENYRFENFQYILYRTEDTICSILNECATDCDSNAPAKGQRLLPNSFDQIKSLEDINLAFDQAFKIICENYSEKKAAKHSELAGQIKDIVKAHYHDGSLNSQRIADMIKMNNAYLGRLFKSSYGHSINDYINTCRLEEGMRLLQKTDCSIDEIAQSVGFSNIKYFFVLFKKLTGVTPAAYRAQSPEAGPPVSENQTER